MQARLHEIAREVLDSTRVFPGERLGRWTNTSERVLRVPGGTREHYPAFWVRDAAMMLGADFVPAQEVAGWIEVVAAAQAGPDGIALPHGLFVPPFSIPDHITLDGVACWYPGAFEEQGVGTYGFLPPADDAFYFVQMVHEHARLTGEEALCPEAVIRAFHSVAADEAGRVVCDGTPGRTRVDWGFCDTIRKSGACLFPSLLRLQAARQLGELFPGEGWANEAQRTTDAIAPAFYEALPDGRGRLLSATGTGRQEDVWGMALALWLDFLPEEERLTIALRLLDLYRAGGTVFAGQVRHLPAPERWQDAVCEPETYQNGGYWGTPTGWYIAALHRVDREAADEMLASFLAHHDVHAADGAPWEWVHPGTGARVNARYASTVGLTYVALERSTSTDQG